MVKGSKETRSLLLKAGIADVYSKQLQDSNSTVQTVNSLLGWCKIDYKIFEEGLIDNDLCKHICSSLVSGT